MHYGRGNAIKCTQLCTRRMPSCTVLVLVGVWAVRQDDSAPTSEMDHTIIGFTATRRTSASLASPIVQLIVGLRSLQICCQNLHPTSSLPPRPSSAGCALKQQVHHAHPDRRCGKPVSLLGFLWPVSAAASLTYSVERTAMACAPVDLRGLAMLLCTGQLV